ncbi:MAG: heme exporter protein CcmB [Actinomycetota bacterium]
MVHDIWLMASKDLKVEFVSRVVASQIVPFGLLILILFGLGLSPDLVVVGDERRSVLEEVAPGLFWIAVLLSALMALGRAFAIEAEDGNLDALRMAGMDPMGVFLGKSLAVAAQLLVLEVILGLGAFVLFGVPLANPVLLVMTALFATVCITLAGTLYASLAAGSTSRDTLVPLLVLPVLAPVLLGATLATRDALFADPGVLGWSWALLLVVFALLYLGLGMLAFGPILEDA